MPRNRITTELRADSAQLRGEFARAHKKVGEFSTGITSVKNNLVGFSAGFLGLRSGIQLFGDFVDSASNLNETLSKTSAIFGEDNTITEWASRQAEALGLSQQAALDYASKFGGALKEIGGNSSEAAAEISQDLVGLSSDLASFFNSSQDDARDAIAAALTGEFEQLKKYNVVINETILKERAMTLGLSDGRGVLDARTKQLAALSLIYEKTGDAQGDFAKTSGGVANQQRILQAELDNTKAKLGQDLLPVQLEFIKIARNGVEVLGILTPALAGAGKVIASLTSFLLDHKEAVKLVVGGYLAYNGAIKAMQFGGWIANLAKTASGLATSTALTQAETAALGRNTVARNQNGASLVKSRLGFLGLAAGTAIAAYELGKFGGAIIAANLEFGEKLNEIDYSQGSAERAKELELVQQLRAQAELENANIIYRNERMKETAKIQAEIAKKRAESRAELQAEINTLAAGVLETELSYKSQNEQLDAQRDKLDDLIKRAREYAKINGLDATGTDTSAGFTDLAREAVGRGELEVAKQLLQVAERMQQKKAEILALEEGIAATAKAKQTQERDLATSQQEALRQQSQELILLKLRAAGRTAEADALEKEIKLRQEARRIAEATGVSEENALKLARQKADLQLKVEGQAVAGNNGLDNRFDADGNRKLARDGERKKIVLIRRDANGNRIDSRAVAAQRAQQKPKPEIPVSKIDRLIQLSEDQLKTWGALQTSS